MGLCGSLFLTIAEAEPFLERGEQMAAKESITRFAAAQVHPEGAREMIYARRKRPCAPGVGPAAGRGKCAAMAQLASWVKAAERSSTRSVRIKGDDPHEVYRSFVGITYITQVSEGR